MTRTRLVPPAEYLRTASQSSLQNFELAKLNRAANLRREIAALIDQWLQEASEALLARYMIDHQDSLREPALSPADLGQAFQNPLLAMLSDASEPPTEIVPAPPRFAEPHRRIAAATHSRQSAK
jgi:hypothetical protein